MDIEDKVKLMFDGVQVQIIGGPKEYINEVGMIVQTNYNALLLDKFKPYTVEFHDSGKLINYHPRDLELLD